ncbi:MAG: nucleotide sugar dehydrogenase [Fimbriimonadaceae bacterium]|nr:nucleotide sugar dehydrogenase [Fimbriimonadaceae bacterium]
MNPAQQISRGDLTSCSSVSFEQLHAKVKDRRAIVGVVGLGYVGLPFAVQVARSGFDTVGLDISREKTIAVNQGESYIGDVSNSDLQQAIQDHGLFATDHFGALADCDVIVVAVPTPLTKNLTPDLRAIEAATREIANNLRPGQLITLESTTFPGTTEEVMQTILESTGLRVEQDFFLAHSPERVDPGNHQFNTKNTNKVVGGVGPLSGELAALFYSSTVDHTVSVSSARAAELVKVYENIFRSVNVALVNELSQLCDRMDINVWEVLDAAFTKPFGIMPFYPGPGVGGHCIPLDPHYLEFKAREYNFQTRFVTLAGEINRSMPKFVVDKAARLLSNEGVALSRARVLVLGVAYKPDIDDSRESPAIHILRLLQDSGAEIFYHDPYVRGVDEEGVTMLSSDLSADLLSSCDLVIGATAHACTDIEWVVEHSRQFLDTRNMTRHLGTRSNVTLL